MTDDTVGAPGFERKITLEEAAMLADGTIYENDDPAQWGITADMGEFLEAERITADMGDFIEVEQMNEELQAANGYCRVCGGCFDPECCVGDHGDCYDELRSEFEE